MFILMAGMASCSATATITDKMKQTMKTSGVAITITSLTDFLAFAVGASSSFLGVRNFCLYIGTLFCIFVYPFKEKFNAFIIWCQFLVTKFSLLSLRSIINCSFTFNPPQTLIHVSLATINECFETIRFKVSFMYVLINKIFGMLLTYLFYFRCCYIDLLLQPTVLLSTVYGYK